MRSDTLVKVSFKAWNARFELYAGAYLYHSMIFIPRSNASFRTAEDSVEAMQSTIAELEKVIEVGISWSFLSALCTIKALSHAHISMRCIRRISFSINYVHHENVIQAK
jgi:hypothetical protein